MDTCNFGALTVLADGAAAMTSSGIGQVDSANRILDLGGKPNKTDLGVVGGMVHLRGIATIDVIALEASNTDNLYEICAMGSNESDGSKPVNLTSLKVGNYTLIPNRALGAASTGAGSTTSAGRFHLPIWTQENNIDYRYLYLYVTVAGTDASLWWMI
jgi:hypothetical protein